MTPKEKAEDLIVKYAFLTVSDFSDENFEQTKQCALTAVNEILRVDLRTSPYSNENPYKYWEEVKQEIEKL